jgi:hypothetical protein
MYYTFLKNVLIHFDDDCSDMFSLFDFSYFSEEVISFNNCGFF